MANSLRRIMAYSLGLFLTKSISLFMLPFLTHSLPVEDIGRLEFLASITALLSIIIGLALHESLYRFSAEKESQQEKQTFANKMYTLTWLMSLIFLPIIFGCFVLIRSWFPEITYREIAVITMSMLLTAPLSISLSWLRIIDCVRSFVTITLTGCVIQVMSIILFVYLDMGVFGVLLASTISHSLQIVIVVTCRYIGLSRPSWYLSQQALVYSIPIALSGVVAFGFHGAEKILIASQSSLMHLASYAISTKFALATCFIIQPFHMWWMSKRFEYLKNDKKAAVSITQMGIVWIAIVGLGMLFLAPMVIDHLLPETYSDAKRFLPVLLCSAVLKEVTELVNIGILHKRQSIQILKINLLSLFIGFLCVAMSWSWGTWGIVFSLLTCQVFKFVSTLFLSQRLTFLPYRSKELSAIVIFLFVISYVSTLVISDTTRSILLIASPTLIIIFSVYFNILPKELITSIMKSKPTKNQGGYVE